MNEVQKAIENITCYSKKFPAEDLQVLCEHQDEAKPYLYKALDYVIEKEGRIEEKYQLHFYALFLLAEFQDREAFERIVTILSLPSDTLDEILGDLITEGMKDILYNTYNGNLQLLKDIISNPEIDEFARIITLDVIGQLYLDGILKEAEWKEYLRNLIASDTDLGVEVYTRISSIICKCRFIDMLPDIYSLFEQDLIGRWIGGDYDDYVDAMFDYRKETKRFCKEKVSVQQIGGWAMYGREDEEEDMLVPAWMDDCFDSLPKMAPAKKGPKIGRNDPCPCGSGKKYKYCCLNKPKEGLDAIEEEENRKIRLKNYPVTGVEKVEGRLYLEDFFDQESIEIDKLLYLGFKCRSASTWRYNPSVDDALVRKKIQYLWEGFLKYTEKMEKEGIQTNEEYDKKYSIHYPCRQWLNVLLILLEDEEDKCQKVLEYSQK